VQPARTRALHLASLERIAHRVTPGFEADRTTCFRWRSRHSSRARRRGGTERPSRATPGPRGLDARHDPCVTKHRGPRVRTCADRRPRTARITVEGLVGKICTLRIRRLRPPGAYLATDPHDRAEEGEGILLPRAEVPEGQILAPRSTSSSTSTRTTARSPRRASLGCHSAKWHFSRSRM